MARLLSEFQMPGRMGMAEYYPIKAFVVGKAAEFGETEAVAVKGGDGL
jgi:hypothetical protein